MTNYITWISGVSQFYGSRTYASHIMLRAYEFAQSAAWHPFWRRLNRVIVSSNAVGDRFPPSKSFEFDLTTVVRNRHWPLVQHVSEWFASSVISRCLRKRPRNAVPTDWCVAMPMQLGDRDRLRVQCDHWLWRACWRPNSIIWFWCFVVWKKFRQAQIGNSFRKPNDR